MMFIIGIVLLISIIGALPFGLVNLSVLETAFHKGRTSALKIAHGASWVEILYGIIALLVGNSIANELQDNPVFRYISISVPTIIGLFFLLRKQREKSISTSNQQQGFFKGIVLNLLSVQVLLYWIVAITWLNASFDYKITPLFVLTFIITLWLGKMGVLWLYAQFSKIIIAKSNFLAKNINSVIGFILIISGLIQYFKP